MDIYARQDARVLGATSLFGLPGYILTTFFPHTVPYLARFPRSARFLTVCLALLTIGSWLYDRVLARGVRDTLVATFTASITVYSDDDLFDYLLRWLGSKSSLSPHKYLTTKLNSQRPVYRPGLVVLHDPLVEVSRDPHQDTERVQYDPDEGLQVLLHRRCLIFCRRCTASGTAYDARRGRQTEVLILRCLGRSSQILESLLEEVYQQYKDNDRSLTIIRTPSNNMGYGRPAWGRLASKPKYDSASLIPMDIKRIVPNQGNHANSLSVCLS